MGKYLRRVPLDFDYPIDKIWEGFINPYRSIRCDSCNGTGFNNETLNIYNEWYAHLRTDGKEGWCHNLDQDDVLALIENDRLWEFTRVPLTDEHMQIIEKRKRDGFNSWLPFNNGYIPTAKEVNDLSRKTILHDSINCIICVESKAKRLNVFGYCPICNGEGVLWDSEENKKLNEEWVEYDPPIGDGYQLWENTSEGSPKSPVFETLEALCEWCEENATTFAYHKATKEEWYEMLSNNNIYLNIKRENDD